VFQAAVFRNGSDEAQLEDVEAEELRADEVLVRIVGAGVCHTDLECRSGFMRTDRPAILGHEGSGLIERVGSSVRQVSPGDHVVLSFSSCGVCAACRADRPFNCHHFGQENRGLRRRDGTSAISQGGMPIGAHFFGQSSFAAYAVAREDTVVPIRKDAPLELLGPLGCGVQTGAGTVINILRPKPGESFVVIGGGGVGLSAVMAAAAEGCAPIIVIEPNPDRRVLALELGAHHAVTPGPDLAAVLARLTEGGTLYIADTAGRVEVLNSALGALRQGGHLAIISAHTMDASLTIPLMTLIGKGISVSGVRMGASIPKIFIPRLVDLYMEGRFPLQKIVRFYPFKEINQALADQEFGRTVKPILRLDAHWFSRRSTHTHSRLDAASPMKPAIARKSL
jgi:aryl-alcohol dehydrogenase